MSIANLWFKHSPNYRIVANCLARYGQFSKRKDYKETILEVGCGDGKATETVLYPYLKDRVEKLMAIDKNDEMIKFAKEHSRIGNIEYRAMDVMEDRTTKEFQSRFDSIFAFMVAHLLPDNRSFLLNLRKMLKDDGQIFVVTVYDNFFRRSYVKQLKEGTWSKYLPRRQPFCDYTNNPREYFRNLLDAAGFQVDFCKAEKTEFYSIDNCKEYVKAAVLMTGDLEKIPAELRDDYIMDHYRNTCEEFVYLGKPDKYDVPAELMVGIATKIP